jgi:hypothetical protein
LDDPGTCLINGCVCLVVCLHNEARGQEVEKSELAKLMQKIDVNYKAVKRISKYHKYEKKHWKTILKSGQNIREITNIFEGH